MQEQNTKKSKLCRCCFMTMAIDNFHKNAGLKDGYSNFCKYCKTENRSRLEKNRRRRNSTGNYLYFSSTFEGDLQWEITKRIKTEYWSGEWHKNNKYKTWE
jgi:hypothetical protein